MHHKTRTKNFLYLATIAVCVDNTTGVNQKPDGHIHRARHLHFMTRPELTYKHYEWWICLVIVVFVVIAITVFGDDLLHGTPDKSYISHEPIHK